MIMKIPNNSLSLKENAVLEQLFQSVKVSLKHFRKNPNKELASLVLGNVSLLDGLLTKYLVELETEEKFEPKINGLKN